MSPDPCNIFLFGKVFIGRCKVGSHTSFYFGSKNVNFSIHNNTCIEYRNENIPEHKNSPNLHAWCQYLTRLVLYVCYLYRLSLNLYYLRLNKCKFNDLSAYNQINQISLFLKGMKVHSPLVYAYNITNLEIWTRDYFTSSESSIVNTAQFNFCCGEISPQGYKRVKTTQVIIIITCLGSTTLPTILFLSFLLALIQTAVCLVG